QHFNFHRLLLGQHIGSSKPPVLPRGVNSRLALGGHFYSGGDSYAILMIISALILAAVSAWATYDRLLTSIVSGQARYAAFAEQRIVDLQTVRSDGLRQLDFLDKDARSIGDQARKLRERGIISKAQELESSALARIDGQREQVLHRLDRASVELTELRARPTASVGLPEALAILLCAGFAIALEAVPALIGSALRVGGLSEPSPAERTASTTPTTITTTTTTDPEHPASGEQQDLFGSPDGALMKTLLDITRKAQPGTPISLRDFTAAARVGNRRAMKLFRAALALGELRKTTAGYVTA
ncbi:hypothetical protein, partial [Pseudomonas syringae group genomosp. 3]